MMNLDMNPTPALTAKDRPYVSFERGEPQEDKVESRKQGHPVYKDVYYACVTSPGSRDRMKEELPDWWDKLRHQVLAGRMPMEWVEKWRSDYDRFMKGLEIPEDGMPILGWSLIPPSMQKTLVNLNIRTVESLAAITDDAKAQIGMGALELQRRAQAWIAQHQDKEPLTIEMAALKGENEQLRATVLGLEEKVKILMESAEAETAKRTKK